MSGLISMSNSATISSSSLNSLLSHITPMDCEPQHSAHVKKAEPPFANRGVDTPYPLFNVSVDWLTASLGVDDAQPLLDRSSHESEGQARPGFKQSEKRLFPGGYVWRRTEPRQESNRWGKRYESWEASGTSASWLARELKAIDSRPSRVDIAFDLNSDRTSDEVLEDLRPQFESRGLLDGISGQGGVNTRYIGGQQSERRIRIYRKDLQDEAWSHLYGPTIRVELILKGKQAAAWWDVWRDSDDSGAFRVAAAHIREMSGLDLIGDEVELPELLPVEQSHAAKKLAQFIRQHAGTLVAFMDAGINLGTLAREQLVMASRMTRYRSSSLTAEVQRLQPSQVERLARALLCMRKQGQSQNHVHPQSDV